MSLLTNHILNTAWCCDMTTCLECALAPINTVKMSTGQIDIFTPHVTLQKYAV